MTSNKNALGLLGAPIVIIAAVGVTVLWANQGGTNPSNRDTPTNAPLAGSAATGSEPAAVVSDSSCDAQATPSFSSAVDPRVLESAKSNPASQAKPAAIPMTRSDALDRSRTISVAGQQQLAKGDAVGAGLAELPAVAVQVPFSQGDKWLGGSVASEPNGLIAPTRCVWAVTVHAPFAPRSVPRIKTAITYDSYTVLYDSLSGEYLGVAAGTDAADLITGARLDR